MINSWLVYVICLLAFSAAQFVPETTADELQIVTLASDPWPPYVTGELGSEATGGIGVELLQAIFDRVDGTRLTMPLVPWNRALQEVERGTKDGIGILLKTAERKKYMVYTDEIFRSYGSVWYSTLSFPNGFDWRSYADLKPYDIGIVRGSSYGKKFDKLVRDQSLSIIEVSSSGQLIAMLNKGRIHLALADQLVGAALVQDYANESHRLLAARKRAAVEVYYIAFSKKSEARHLIPAINEVVRQLKREGVIQSLLGRNNTAVGMD